MPQRTLKQRKWGFLFLALHLLLLSQIVWWAIVFSKYVNTVQTLQHANARLEAQLNGATVATLSDFSKEAFHQKLMFFSESGFFAVIASLALWLLFRALKTEERSREVQKNFVEVLTHESKTPLTALKLRLEYIQEKVANLPVVGDVRRALEEVRRLTSIIEKSLELNRMERYSLSVEELDLAEVTASVLKVMEPLCKQKGVQITSELGQPIWMEGDSFGLRNSIQSLIENSVHYNDSEEKHLKVAVERRGETAVVTVQDNGPGINSQEENLIFERFYRGKAGKRVPGTGLGLYLSKKIIGAHRGEIKLIPEKKGAHFEIQLPLPEGVI